MDLSVAAGGFGRPDNSPSAGPTAAASSIPEAMKTHLRNDIMRNGLNSSNAMMARMIDGDGGVFDTMANMGMGDMREAQVAYAETSMQGNMFLLHSATDLARSPGTGNGMMIDAYATDPDLAGRAPDAPSAKTAAVKPPSSSPGQTSSPSAEGGAPPPAGPERGRRGEESRRLATKLKHKKISAAAAAMGLGPALVAEPTDRAYTSPDRNESLPPGAEPADPPTPEGAETDRPAPPAAGTGASLLDVATGATAAAMAGAAMPGQPPGQAQQGPFAPKPQEKKESAPAPKSEASATKPAASTVPKPGSSRYAGFSGVGGPASDSRVDDDKEEWRKKRKRSLSGAPMPESDDVVDNRIEDDYSRKKRKNLETLLEEVAKMEEEEFLRKVRRPLERRIEFAEDPRTRQGLMETLARCMDVRRRNEAEPAV